MSNAKPYLFGAVLGASAMYVALQYHVVHSHDGFQMVPRTPQQSVGLAYADVRNYTASQWTDRPELARALMAHGASDLISESVANSLADGVAEENSTLDQLRSFLDTSAMKHDASAAPGLLEIPGSGTTPERTPEKNDDDLTRIPFPQDAKNTVVADPFRVAQGTETSNAITATPPRPNGTSRFTTADVIDGLRDDADLRVDSFIASPPQKRGPANSQAQNGPTAARTRSTVQDAKAMEDRIFGGSASVSTAPKPAPAAAATDSMFEEVSTQLENRAQAALQRATDAATDKASNTTSGAAKASESYLRQRIENAAPAAAKSIIKSESVDDAAKSAGSLLDQFDPFLE